MTFLFFKYDLFYQFIHLFVYLLIYLFIYIFIYLLIYLFIHYFLITIFPDQLVKRDQPRSPWTLGQGPSRSHALTAYPHRSLWASLVGVSLGHLCLGTASPGSWFRPFTGLPLPGENPHVHPVEAPGRQCAPSPVRPIPVNKGTTHVAFDSSTGSSQVPWTH